MSKTFTELGALTSLAGVDVLAVVDMTDSTTKKITATNIAAFLADLEQTLTSKTLTSPVLNGTLSGTAFLDEDDMASDSAIAAASQQSIKAHVASGAVTFSNKNFSQSGTVTITDTGATTAEYPLKIFTPSLSDSGGAYIYFGVDETSLDHGYLRFFKVGDGNIANSLSLGIVGVGAILRLDGSGHVGINADSDGDTLYVSGTGEYTDTLTLSKASGTGLSVTSDIDFNAIASGATKAELNSRCDGVPSYSAADTSGVTVTSTPTTVTTLDLGTVTSGDVFYIEADIEFTKGGTGGKDYFYINKSSGTATISFTTGSEINDSNDASASTTYARHIGGMCFVTGSGTLVMRLRGTATGSDATVGSGYGDLAATFIKKQ